MALIPPEYFDAVVALGTVDDDGIFVPTGTGFLYGYPRDIDPADGEHWFNVFLVTNRHVVEGVRELYARFNSSLAIGPQVISLDPQRDSESARRAVHPRGADIAVISISSQALAEAGIDFKVFRQDQNTLSLDQVHKGGISEGNGVFLLGFPLGLAGDDRNYVIARQGAIARFEWPSADDVKAILVDASIFPGSSGSPVVTRPESVSIKDTQSFMRCCLIGIVESYLPYEDVAVSQQTGKARVVFTENSGLGIVLPCDAIEETIRTALADELNHREGDKTS